MTIEQEIDQAADPSSRRYGRLLNWQNPPDPFWHYGIGLSDQAIFDTGQGLRVFKRANAKQVIGIESIAFPQEKVIERLKHAVHVFKGWKYNVLGWNCEHLARLIATGKPRCYQSAPVWFLCDLSRKGDHHSASRIQRPQAEQWSNQAEHLG